ncbi:MAG: nucleotidyltransferase family protein, partial [Candidatus Acidiferrales bacterium]
MTHTDLSRTSEYKTTISFTIDSVDLSSESENDYAAKAGRLFRDPDIAIDVKNEARLHLWYEQHFGYKIAPYESVEHAISTWPTTATSVAITTGTDGIL